MYVLLFVVGLWILPVYPQEDLQAEYDALKEEYEKVCKDRDNLLIQIQNFSQDKEEVRRAKDEVERIKSKIKEVEVQKEDLGRKIMGLNEHVASLQKERGELLDTIAELEKHIEKREIEYKIVEKIQGDMRRMRVEENKLMRQKQQLEEKIKRLESEKVALKAEAEIYLRQIREQKSLYSEALRTNKRLEKKLSEVPKKFAEIARENKVLIKETALMHYNLGVFYIEEGQYKRAIAELEKAVELNPEDAYAYFNLGYIYAEYLVERSKAIDYFRQYLKLARKDDKEIDWVKKYILTWQTWDAKKPLK
jgi:tetratricopeptide (TPR) repeat protein